MLVAIQMESDDPAITQDPREPCRGSLARVDADTRAPEREADRPGPPADQLRPGDGVDAASASPGDPLRTDVPVAHMGRHQENSPPPGEGLIEVFDTFGPDVELPATQHRQRFVEHHRVVIEDATEWMATREGGIPDAWRLVRHARDLRPRSP